MKMKDWLLAGFDPAFATVDDWIADLVGRVGAEEEAIYALRSRIGGREGVRIVVATDLGLFDFFWYRPEAVKDRSLTGRHIPWPDVRGLSLSCETRLNPATLLRNEPKWQLSIEEPSLSIEDAPVESVVLEFWRACYDGITKGSP